MLLSLAILASLWSHKPFGMSDDRQRSPVEGSVRRNKLRAGHWRLVTRIIGSALKSADVRKLKQLIQFLVEKSGILA